MKPTVAEVEVLSVLFSSGFDSPNVKVPLEELFSVLEEPVPKTIPLFPNLNPVVAGCSDFLFSLDAVSNVLPSDEAPNLNPDEAVVSLVSDAELPKDVPNLNTPDAEDESGKEPLNLKPPDPIPDESLSAIPNLIPPEAEEPKGEELLIPVADEPKTLPNTLVSTLAPGLSA